MTNSNGRRVPFVLPPEKVVRVLEGELGECLACDTKGILAHRLGTLWEGRRQLNLFGKELVHKHWCPMNKFLYAGQSEGYNRQYQKDYQRAYRKAQDERK